MKTKNSFRAMATIVASLMLISLLVFSGRTARADSPATVYQKTMVHTYRDYGGSSITEGKLEFTYGDCGNTFYHKVWSKDQDGEWVLKNDWTWTWDEYCNLLERACDIQYNGIIGYERYTYDCNGNVLTKVEGSGIPPAFYKEISTTYTYDVSGNMLTYLFEYYDGDDVVFWDKYTWTYDGDGNKLTELYEDMYNGWIYFDIMTYDDDGHILSNIRQLWDGISWYDDGLKTWTYDKVGNLLIYERMLKSGTGSRETYTYDALGNWLTLLKKNFSDGGWTNSSLETRTFDVSGNCLTHFTQNWVSGAWVDNTLVSRTYDEDGNIVSILTQNYAPIKTLKVEYIYAPGEITGSAYKLVGEEWVPTVTNIQIFLNVEGKQYDLYDSYGSKVEVEYITTPEQLEAEITPYQTVYYGYPPEECATLSVTPINGTPPYTYEWSTKETTASIEVCPTESTDYSVIITDAIGCKVKACTRVCVIDVRCGPKLDKVLLCHLPDPSHSKPQTLCVAQAAVPAHLAHGDQLGFCGIDHTCTDELKSAPADAVVLDIEQDMFIKAYPNPVSQSAMVTYLVNQPEKVTITLVNTMGQPVMTIFEGYSPEGEIQEMEVGMGDLQPGIYLLILQQEDGTRITEKLLKQR